MLQSKRTDYYTQKTQKQSKKYRNVTHGEQMKQHVSFPQHQQQFLCITFTTVKIMNMPPICQQAEMPPQTPVLKLWDLPHQGGLALLKGHWDWHGLAGPDQVKGCFQGLVPIHQVSHLLNSIFGTLPTGWCGIPVLCDMQWTFDTISKWSKTASSNTHTPAKEKIIYLKPFGIFGNCIHYLSWLGREDYQGNVRKNWHVGSGCKSQQTPCGWVAPGCAVPKWKPWTSMVEAIRLSWLTCHFYCPRFAACLSVLLTNYCTEGQAWQPTPLPSGSSWWWLPLCRGQSNHSLCLYQVQDWPDQPFGHDWPHGPTQQKGPKTPSYHLLWGDPSPAWNLYLTLEGRQEI